MRCSLINFGALKRYFTVGIEVRVREKLHNKHVIVIGQSTCLHVVLVNMWYEHIYDQHEAGVNK